MRCKTRRPAGAPLNPHLSATGQLQGCSPAQQNHTTRNGEGCNKFGSRRFRSRCRAKKMFKTAESDHVTVSRSRVDIFGWSEFFSVVLMDIPKVASVIGLLSSDKSSDCNEAMPGRMKQRVRQHSSTTFQLKWSKTWPCIQLLKTDPSKATCTVRFPTHVNITSMIFPGITKKGWNAFNCNCVNYVEYRAQ